MVKQVPVPRSQQFDAPEGGASQLFWQSRSVVHFGTHVEPPPLDELLAVLLLLLATVVPPLPPLPPLPPAPPAPP